MRKKKQAFCLIVILLIAFVLYLSFSPTSSAKRLVAKYNRWSDPGLIQGEGLSGLFKFFFMNKLASSKLSSVLSDDCKVIVKNYDGTNRYISGKDYVAGLTGIRFTSNVKQIILTKPEYEPHDDNIIATMTKAFIEGHAVAVTDTRLVIDNSGEKLLISEIQNTLREPTDEELGKVRKATTTRRYNPKKGLKKVFYVSPSFSPDGKKVVFASLRHESPEIYTVNIDGSDLRRITETKYCELNPSFTPDGQSILFYSDKDNYAGEPYLIDIDGANYRKLVPEHPGVSDVCFSPDGDLIAFSIQRSMPKEIYIMRVDGTGLKQITRSGRDNSSLVFSPDGERIFFKQRWFEYDKDSPLCEEIFSVSIDGTGLEQLTNDRVRKNWLSVIDSNVLYSVTRIIDGDHRHKLWMDRLDGTKTKLVLGGKGNSSYTSTKVLPSFNHIVFINDGIPYRYELYLKELFGEGRTKSLTKDSDRVSGAFFDVSSDGQYVVYIAQKRKQYEGERGEIRIIHLKTGKIKTIGTNY